MYDLLLDSEENQHCLCSRLHHVYLVGGGPHRQRPGIFTHYFFVRTGKDFQFGLSLHRCYYALTHERLVLCHCVKYGACTRSLPGERAQAALREISLDPHYARCCLRSSSKFGISIKRSAEVIFVSSLSITGGVQIFSHRNTIFVLCTTLALVRKQGLRLAQGTTRMSLSVVIPTLSLESQTC